jgi:hypothetical protein
MCQMAKLLGILGNARIMVAPKVSPPKLKVSTGKKDKQSDVHFVILKEFYKFKPEEVHLALQALYTHEITFRWLFMFDGGYGDFCLGKIAFGPYSGFSSDVKEAPGELLEAGSQYKLDDWKIEDAVSYIAYMAACLEMDDNYVKWYKSLATKNGKKK